MMEADSGTPKAALTRTSIGSFSNPEPSQFTKIADEFKPTFARDVTLKASALLHAVQGIENSKIVMVRRTKPIMKQATSQPPVEFIVTFYKCSGNGNNNPFADLINVMFSRRSSRTPCDEHGYYHEEWTYFMALKDVDTFEQAVARCSDVVTYERSLIPGECARTKTVFARQGPSQ